MTTKSTDLILEPTLADAFDMGKKEGLKESFTEIKQLISQGMKENEIKIYIEARLKSVQEFSLNNPFKTKG